MSQKRVTGKLELVGGNNMAAVHLSDAVGGDLFMGFISAVAFATILAVVAGLTLSGASAISHDFMQTYSKRSKLRLNLNYVCQNCDFRFSNLCHGPRDFVRKQNVAFMVGLAFSVACCANFPVLVLSMFWKGLTTRGAVIGGVVGLVGAVSLIIFIKSSLG